LAPDLSVEGETMAGVEWMIKGREFANCNCAYGCPCQFNALPTHGDCAAVVGMQIDEGHHGGTRLDGLKVVTILSWPGPIHLGRGQAQIIIDERATPAQRDALLRILSGQDTEPGATVFQVFSTTLEKVHEPQFKSIAFEADVGKPTAQIKVDGWVDARGEAIVNPITNKPHRARVNLPDGFEYTTAEYGRGWSKTSGPIAMELGDSHAHFCNLHLTGAGVVR
jgi:hypothetical protein